MSEFWRKPDNRRRQEAAMRTQSLRVEYEWRLHLTRTRSATTGGNARRGGIRGLSHEKRGRTPASGWLHRMVRRAFVDTATTNLILSCSIGPRHIRETVVLAPTHRSEPFADRPASEELCRSQARFPYPSRIR